MKRLLATLLLIPSLALLAPVVAHPAYAACTSGNGNLDNGISGGFTDPGCGQPNLDIFIQLIVNVLNFLLKFAAVVAVIMLIVSGIIYIISRGRPDLMEQALQSFKFAIWGLIIVIISYVIVYGLNSFISGHL